MTAEEWVARFAEEIGSEGASPQDTEEVLRLAAAAAHASERTAAPVACWIAGRTGRPIAELAELAERLESA